MAPSKEKDLGLLKAHFAITPKTANMLYACGYTSPQSLRNRTPNEVTAKFAALPGMDAKKAKWYTRALRRMVMLGDIEDTQRAIQVAKRCQKWSNVHLMKLGVFETGFDDLTGVHIREKMESAGALP